MKKHICIALSLAVLLLTGCHSTPPVQLPANSTPEPVDVTTTVRTSITTTETTTFAKTTLPTKSKTTVKKTTPPTLKTTVSSVTKATAAVTTVTTPKAETKYTRTDNYLYRKSVPVRVTMKNENREEWSSLDALKYEKGDNQWIFDLIKEHFPQEPFLDEWVISFQHFSSNSEWSDELSKSRSFITGYYLRATRYINGVKTDYNYEMLFDKEHDDTYAGDVYICEEIRPRTPIYDPATMQRPQKLSAKKEAALCKSERDRVYNEMSEVAQKKYKGVVAEQDVQYMYRITTDQFYVGIETSFTVMKKVTDELIMPDTEASYKSFNLGS